MNLLQLFKQYVSQDRLFTATDRLLIAVSGGVDSVVLCDLCYRSGYSFRIAHVNFRLRGEESVRDEAFVRSMAERYQVPFLVTQFNTEEYAAAQKISIQVAARQLRYEWFLQVPETDYLLTAHHADDNIETVLMNFFKGTGIAGLHGILPKQDRLVRPLLFARKEAILAYATQQALPFVEDSSNASDKYTRNYFRQQLIPALEKVYPEVKENLLNSILRFRDVELLYNQAVHGHKLKLLEYKGAEVHIPVLKLLKVVPLETIVYEIIKAYHFTPHQVKDVVQLTAGESGKYIASSTHRVIRNRNWLIISPIKAGESAFIVIEENDKITRYPGGQLQKTLLPVEELNASLTAYPEKGLVDASLLQYPLLLRKWKQGDYFYPLGMKKKKKLSRFFIDQKMSLTDKENAWVLETNKKIVWVAGKRIDDRFKVTSGTRQVVAFELIKTPEI